MHRMYTPSPPSALARGLSLKALNPGRTFTRVSILYASSVYMCVMCALERHPIDRASAPHVIK